MRLAGYYTLLALLFATEGQASPPDHSLWQLLPEFSDEFNRRQLEKSKWKDHNPYFTGPPPGVHSSDNVLLQEGKLLLSSRMQHGAVTTSTIQSLEPLQYGYLEIRAKTMPSHILNGFWLYRYTDTATFEIDIVEMAGTAEKHEQLVHTNTHVYYGDPKLEDDHNRHSTPYAWPSGQRLRDDFHIYALEWNEEELRWYFDGKLIRRKSNQHFHGAMRIHLTTETQPRWVGMPTAKELPAALEVDYIRVYRQLKKPSDGSKYSPGSFYSNR